MEFVRHAKAFKSYLQSVGGGNTPMKGSDYFVVVMGLER